MTDRVFGHIEDAYEGQMFSNRLELSYSGLHKPTQAGISGSQNEGADSIVISGGYEDDEDYGDIIVYTGHGGRKDGSTKQVVDQELVRGNKALALNVLKGLPVRVIRGTDHKSNYAPQDGYRYDGLYLVEDYWKDIGKSGFVIWRYRLRKLIDGDSTNAIISREDPEDYKSTKRIRTTVQRIVRDTELNKSIKLLYNYKCQVCDQAIETSSGLYAEAAHIKPLGVPHNGPDTLNNILCLCPNHHVMFDYGGFSILEDYDLIGIEGKLKTHPKHNINKEFLKYHLDHFYDEKNRF